MKNFDSQKIGFFVLLGLMTLLVAFMWLPFVRLLILAVILAMLFYPVYDRLKIKSHSANFSAGVVMLLIAVIIAGPVLFIGQQVFYELLDLYKLVNPDNWAVQSAQFVARLPHPLQTVLASYNLDVHSWVTQIASQAVVSLSGLLSSLGWFFGSLVLLGFSIFFLLRDGEKIVRLLTKLLPLSESHENILFHKISSAVNGVVKGQFLVVLTISTASFFGFSLFGLPKALLWACAMFFVAFVPTFGTSLIFIPAVGYLYFTGNVGSAVGLTVWAGLSVLLIDNILANKIVSSKARLYPLFTLFGILGGIEMFGVLGLLIGPIIMALLVALVDIYLTDIKGV